MRAQLRIRDQHVDAGITQDKIHLVGLEEIVDRHDYRAGLKDAEHRWDEFRAILEPKSYPVAGFDPIPLLELARDEVREVPEFVEGVSRSPQNKAILGECLRTDSANAPAKFMPANITQDMADCARRQLFGMTSRAESGNVKSGCG